MINRQKNLCEKYNKNFICKCNYCLCCKKY